MARHRRHEPRISSFRKSPWLIAVCLFGLLFLALGIGSYFVADTLGITSSSGTTVVPSASPHGTTTVTATISPSKGSTSPTTSRTKSQ